MKWILDLGYNPRKKWIMDFPSRMMGYLRDFGSRPSDGVQFEDLDRAVRYSMEMGPVSVGFGTVASVPKPCGWVYGCREPH